MSIFIFPRIPPLVIKAFHGFVVLTPLLVDVSPCSIVLAPLLVNTSSSFATH